MGTSELYRRWAKIPSLFLADMQSGILREELDDNRYSLLKTGTPTMNSKRLRIYLNDHLALMVGETELIARCRASNRRTPLAEFLEHLESEIIDQQNLVAEVLKRIGGKQGMEGLAKQSAAWLAEKLGRFKMNDSLLSYSDLSRVIELEALAATSLERILLWDSLEALSGKDSCLADLDFSSLRDQSQTHLDELNTRRRYWALEAFGG